MLLPMRRLTFAFLLLAAASAYAQQRDDAFLDDLDRVRTFNDVAISPDGKHVAWAVQGIGVTTATTAGMDVRLLPGDGDDHYVAWSPDSKELATIGDGSKNQRQIFITHVGGTPVRVTNVHGYLAEPRWSPDGKSIAFLFIENAKRAAAIADPIVTEAEYLARREAVDRIMLVRNAGEERTDDCQREREAHADAGGDRSAVPDCQRGGSPPARARQCARREELRR